MDVKVEDKSVDCVVTDPPYGVEYIPSRKTSNPKYDLEKKAALELLNDACKIIRKKIKDDAHLYFFCSDVNVCEFRNILKRYFDVHDNILIWVKNNHTPCDFKKRYASIHELILFCSNKKRELNRDVSPDVLVYDKPYDKKHDAQKPTELLEYLIENSTDIGDVVLDPFMGSGSTIISAIRKKRIGIGFEKDEEIFRDALGGIGGIDNEAGQKRL
jgi:DNA modification methylase